MDKKSPSVEETIALLQRSYPESIETVAGIPPGIKVKSQDFLSVIAQLKEWGYNYLADITAVEGENELTCVYHLMSLDHFGMLKIKVDLDKENPQIPTIVDYWPAANVQEREVYDMFGIKFIGHPNLKRILCPDDFQGHPLRKDFQYESRR